MAREEEGTRRKPEKHPGPEVPNGREEWRQKKLKDYNDLQNVPGQ